MMFETPDRLIRLATRAAADAPASSEGPPDREACINCGTTRGGLTANRKYERTNGPFAS
jgi:hypothetical protein